MHWLRDHPGSVAFHLPSPRLLGTVRGYVVRDTTGLPPLPEAARRNHYPASGYAALIWLLHGTSVLLEHPSHAGQPLPDTVLMGAHRRPWRTYNPGPVRSFGIVFKPQALHRLAGLNMAEVVDRPVAVQSCFNAEWQAWCETVRAAPDDAARICAVEDFLLRAQRMNAHTATDALATSTRSLARRMREWLGLPPRDGAVLDRLERTLLRARRQDADRHGTWADVAAEGGYSDQAHLCRHTRRSTGLSPRQLAEQTATDEGYWFYRLWDDEHPAGDATPTHTFSRHQAR